MSRTMSNPVIVLLGPTGVGKTALAVQLAPALDGEIVSADSRQVYRWMDLGTAKPTPAQRAAVPHHLIDLVDPDEVFTLADFCDRARAALDEIAVRGRQPFLVGGTGQYLAALLEGWRVPRVPPQPDLRARLKAQARQEGVEALYRRLQQLDPPAAAGILPGNLRRIVRALEVIEMTGDLFSRQQGRETPWYDFLILGLTMERAELYACVDRRVEEMVEQGLAEEVRALLARGYSWSLPSMSGLGYSQLRPVIEGRSSLQEAVGRIQYDTHAFIRHQYSWFRRFPVSRWFDAGRPEELQEVEPTMWAWLESRAGS